MRILHTSDWHLGRTMGQESLIEDQAAILDQIHQAMIESGAQAIIIAGDIFDRAVPARDAVDLFDRFLTRIYRETSAAIIAIAGNHDAPERLGFGGALQDPTRVLIRGPLTGRAEPLVLEDEHGPVAFSALPFCEVYAARHHYGAAHIACPADVLAMQISEARRRLPEGARWIVAAHAFVQGASATQSERSLDFVGGVETCPPDLFSDCAYVALGHLHRAQTAGADHIRYSGSPMAFGFDEAGVSKSVSIVDIGPGGMVGAAPWPLTAPRPVRVLEGRLEDLVALGAGGGRRDFVKAVLTDEGELVDPMGRLRTVYPFALQIERAGVRRGEAEAAAAAGPRPSQRAPLQILEAFLQDLRGKGLSEQETRLAGQLLGRAHEPSAVQAPYPRDGER